MVPADSQQISRARCYLGTQIAPPQGFQVRDSHPLRPTLPSRSPNPRSISARSGRTGTSCPTTPHTQPLPGITRMRFSLIRVRSPLLTESLLFSLPAGTEMFHFPAFPPHTLCIQMWVTRHHACWVSPFGHPRITARLAAPRGLSQPTTSFIGSWCQGIHRVLLHTYIHKQLKMLASTVQFSNNTHQPHPHPQTRRSHQMHRESVPSETTKPEGSMVLFQTPNSVFRPDHANAGTRSCNLIPPITASPTR